MNWIIIYNNFFKTTGSIHLLPEFYVWFDKYRFLETGLYTPAFGFRICWIKWGYSLGLQKGY